jgi:GntR family transcriptional regulator
MVQQTMAQLTLEVGKMSAIERNSPMPLYYQLKMLLAERIDNDDWQPGDMLPTEEQLGEQYGLSRTTVRQALRELELEGRISRYRGLGTFVSKPKISHSPDPRFSLTDFLLEQGMQPSWRVLSAEWISAPADIAERLSLEAGSEVFRLRRLRLASEEPIGYHVAHAVHEFAAEIAALDSTEQGRFVQGGSLDYLRQTGRLADSYANRIIEAIPASKETANLLNIDRGSPILSIRRRVFTPTGVPIEDLRAVYRGDRLQYHVRQWTQD